jgi:predicted lipid-binding transport protein (Tim44 family)
MIMSAKSCRSRALSALAIGLVLSTVAAGSAEARRGGSFGSRGYRTYSAPRSSFTAPQAVGPVQRSMTNPYQAPYQPGLRQPGGVYPGPGYNYGYRPQGGFLNRWGGPILGGFLGAGLFGMLFGHHFGGWGGGFGGGLIALILQLALIALAVGFVMRLFRRNRPGYAPPFAEREPFNMGGPQPGFFGGPQSFNDPPSYQATPVGSKWGPGDEIGLTQADFDSFERLLTDVQAAVSREDYDALRQHATPEVMSYLTEELAQNAAAGRRNEVRDVRLVAGDLSEAWSEENRDYATVAMRYSSIDVMRDRRDGRVVEGVEAPTETTELWTFVRERSSPWGGGVWKLSAIQDARA